MYDILCYDANPTVRALVKKALKGTDLKVIDIDKLEMCSQEHKVTGLVDCRSDKAAADVGFASAHGAGVYQFSR